jgi:protein-tyrosine-phosphatase
VDLSPSRSKRIDDAMVAEADLILAMELKHLERLAAEFPAAKDKARLLSAVTTNREVPLEIADPYGLEEADYVRCFEQVTACTRAIVDAK